MPELSGARLAPLGEPRLQERVQRHTVDQIIETFVPVQILDDPAPLVVDQLMEILKITDMASFVEQVIAVPKISCPSRPLRVAVVDTEMAEQLVNVPNSLLPRGQYEQEEGDTGTVPGRRWLRMAPLRQATGGLLGTRTTQWNPPKGYTASPWRYINTRQV